MTKFAFSPGGPVKTLSAKHEDGWEEHEHYTGSRDEAYSRLYNRVHSRYKGGPDNISSSEAGELVRFDTKLGALKWNG